jgi:hypothetical protein
VAASRRADQGALEGEGWRVRNGAISRVGCAIAGECRGFEQFLGHARWASGVEGLLWSGGVQEAVRSGPVGALLQHEEGCGRNRNRNRYA